MNLEKDFKLFANDNGISTQKLIDFRNSVNNSYINPTVIEERRLNVASMDVFSRLFMERILFLHGEIDSDLTDIITCQMLFLEMTNDEKPITMYVNSPGGSVNAGLVIYDMFKYLSCPITTTTIGMAASMGAIIASSGDKGSRFALPHSKIMIHQPMGGMSGQAADMKIQWEEMEKYKKDLYTILSENTGKSYEEIEDACDRDKWYTAREAVEYGLIDEVIKSKKK